MKIIRNIDGKHVEIELNETEKYWVWREVCDQCRTEEFDAYVADNNIEMTDQEWHDALIIYEDILDRNMEIEYTKENAAHDAVYLAKTKVKED